MGGKGRMNGILETVTSTMRIYDIITQIKSGFSSHYSLNRSRDFHFSLLPICIPPSSPAFPRKGKKALQGTRIEPWSAEKLPPAFHSLEFEFDEFTSLKCTRRLKSGNAP
jgi:hypothetical protein